MKKYFSDIKQFLTTKPPLNSMKLPCNVMLKTAS